MLTNILVIIGVIAILAVAYYIIWKKGKINDRDGDYIPDEIEDAADKVKGAAKEVKRRAKNVKAELGDVKKAAKELGEQLEDVAEAAAGKTRKGRKPAKKRATKKK